jgi:biopolymer transport protein ExbB
MNDFFEQIGPAGWVLAGAAVWSVYLFTKQGVYLIWVTLDFKKKFKDLENGKLELLGDERRQWNPMMAIMHDIVRFHAHHSRDLKSEVAFLFYKYFRKANRAAAWLRMISVVAPLLGLMGTVLGMVSMFRSLAVDAQVDASLLAGGIWEALLTTVLGLAVAIPTLIFYYIISLRLKGFTIEAVEYGYRMAGIVNPGCPYGSPGFQTE